MKNVSLDDYLLNGPRTALDVVQEITGQPRVDIVGLCLGGALTAMTAAYLAETGDNRIGTVTLLNTLLDYAEPGALGQSPPAFDILAWNADSTRMPAAMHSFYLRSLYIRNQLARGELELAGQRLSLPDVASDAYVVGAINDHIVPWQASYRATQLLGGSVRYVLTSGGHIAGIVNPPNPKAWYEVSDRNPPTPAEWRDTAHRHGGSWWEDWATWAGERAGELVAPPPLGTDRHPAAGDAPGDYVRG